MGEGAPPSVFLPQHDGRRSVRLHGNPIAILKGRVIAVGLVAIYHVAGTFSMQALLVLAALMAVAPWLIQRSISFRLSTELSRVAVPFCRRWRRLPGVPDVAHLGYITLMLLIPQAHRDQALSAQQQPFRGCHFADLASGPSTGFTSRRSAARADGRRTACSPRAGLLGTIAGEALRATRENIGLITVGVHIYLLLFLVIGPWFAARMQNLV
jgi:hypothetical protein